MHARISETLQKLQLSHVEDQLGELGVCDASDVLELEKEDLQGIGLNLVQIRKLQNALKGDAPAGDTGGWWKAKVEVDEQAAQVAECPAGHALTPVVAEHARYECDTCQKPVRKGQSVYGCRDCNYDVCKMCATGQADTNGNGNTGAAKTVIASWTHKGGNRSGGGGAPKARAVPKTAFKRKFLEFCEGDFDAGTSVAQRGALDIVIDGGPNGTDNYHPPITTFEELTELPAHCILALNNMGITSPMPIQAQAIPIVMSGEDLVGVAKTGSGKTLAYLLPAVAHIEAQEPIGKWDLSPLVIALAPTRELAVQIHEEAEKLLSCSKGEDGSKHPDGIKACCIYGGMKKDGQLKSAMGAHIIAATPGRLHEHVMKDDISFERVTYFILDEGDRMLEEGFESQVKTISNAIRPDRHMLFFSATWPMEVHRLAKAMCMGAKPPVRLRVGQNSDGSAKTRDDIVQEVVVFDQGSWDERDKEKKELMYNHVREALAMDETKVLVFVSRKDLADEMSYCFNGEGFESEAMHGGKPQETRLATLEEFKSGSTRLLVATDVMGRGLDIPTITHVVVYDMGDIEDYVHRVGRTARGPHGQGHALTLFEYDPRWPHLAEGLMKVLEDSNQFVPDELRTISSEVEAGERETKSMKGRYGKLSGNQGDYNQIQKKIYGGGNSLAKW